VSIPIELLSLCALTLVVAPRLLDDELSDLTGYTELDLKRIVNEIRED
jgi:hypothetical protein